MPSNSENLYEILGVKKKATPDSEEIKHNRQEVPILNIMFTVRNI